MNNLRHGVAASLVAAMSISLAACSDSSESADVSSDTQVSASQQAEEQTTEESVLETSSEAPATTEFAGTGGEIVLGEPIEFEDFSVTIKSLSVITDYEGKPALKVVYDWTNNGEDTNAPFTSFSITGFQNGVETDDFVMSDQLDLGIGQNNVRPGATITDAEDAVVIADMAAPLELELTEWISWDDVAYLYIIDDLNAL